MSNNDIIKLGDYFIDIFIRYPNNLFEKDYKEESAIVVNFHEFCLSFNISQKFWYSFAHIQT